MNRKLKLWIGLGVVAVVAIVATGVFRAQRGKVTPVQFAKVRREDVTSRVKAPGKIEPRTQVKISADIAGKIVVLRVKEGDAVRRGDLMLQLDDMQYRSLHLQALASLASAKARQREADTALQVASATFQRQRALFDQRLLSQAEWDAAVNAHEKARVTLATAQEEVARTQAAAHAAANNLSKCRILAPFDGVVSALNVEKGEIVITGTMNNPGSQILVVSDLSRMLVRAEVDETDVVDMSLGQKARISVDAFPDTTFDGTVIEIGNTAKRSSISSVEGQTNFEVKVVFDHAVPEIRPGMTADIEVAVGTHERTLAVPIQAVVIRTQSVLDLAARGKGRSAKRTRANPISAEEDTAGRRDPELSGVLVVKDGVTRWVPVRAGLASETMIEVTGDLKEGDLVVSGPYKALRELMPGRKVEREKSNAKGRP